MDIEIRGGDKPLWVSEFGCFLANGECAFYYEPELYPKPPLPAWFEHPGESVRRDSRERDFYSPNHPLKELRSMTADVESVIAFYQECLIRGELDVREDVALDHDLKATTFSRIEPGFFAENAAYYFELEAYQHREVAFWAIKHGAKHPPSFRPKKRGPKYLLLVGQSEGLVTLRDPESGEECWARQEHLSDVEPIYLKQFKAKKPRKEEPLLWSRLPAWVQFDLPVGITGSAAPTFRGGWAAGISALKCVSPIHDVLEACLDSLDAYGFSRIGTENSERSYYVEPSMGGRHLHTYFKTEAGESGGLVLVDAYAGPSMYIHYQTSGTLFPVDI